MGIISIRLNKKEENILNYLIKHFDKDRSTIIKSILIEKYEDLQDLKVIEKYEKEEKAGKIAFISANEILNRL